MTPTITSMPSPPRGGDLANAPAIITEGLSRDFGTLRAVDHLSIIVPAGQIYGFLGTNGAGKTTTIRLLLGLLAPTEGSALVLGHDIRTASAAIRAESGALLEYNGLYEKLTAYDNLDFYGRIWGMARAARAARIAEVMEAFGLNDRAHDRVETWSRGMKQKLAVARALLHHPRLVFLDEPTDGLDPAAAAALRQDLAALVTREATTIFLTTHNLTDAEQLCARVAIMRSGVLLAEGTPADLRARTGEQRVVIRGSGFTPTIIAGLRSDPTFTVVEATNSQLVLAPRDAATPSHIVSALVAAGAQVAEVQNIIPSFEETFLTIVARGQQEANHD